MRAFIYGLGFCLVPKLLGCLPGDKLPKPNPLFVHLDVVLAEISEYHDQQPNRSIPPSPPR